MPRLPILLALAFCVHVSAGIAQMKQRVPIITLGRIMPPEKKNGKYIPTQTTRQQILKNSLFLADVNNCRVTEYKFTMIAPGKGLYGPVYVASAELPDSLKNKIKTTDGPGVNIYIEDVKMNYRGNIMDANPVYITYDE